MAELQAVAGWRFYIGPVISVGKEDLTVEDFTGLVFTEVDGWETMGTFGDTSEIINTALINRRRNVKQKGTRDAGDMENTFATLAGQSLDEGQQALLDAEKTDDNYAIKIEANDAEGDGAPTRFFFAALVTSAAFQGGGANTIQMLSSTLGINSNIVRVNAGAA